MDRRDLSDMTGAGAGAGAASPAVDAACDRFEARWRDGPRPAIEDHLEDVSPDDRPALARELVLIDAAWRRRAHERPSASEYLERFPGLSTDDLERELARDSRRAGQGGAPPVLGRFELSERLGTGSFGTTWRAHDPKLGRDVALKLAHVEAGEQTQRFEREARAAARLKHPGIATVHEVLALDGRAALVTELIDGASLRERLATGWKPSPREAAALVVSLCDALHHAHALGVVHRDVKPANVVIERETGRPVLVDFGLALDASAHVLTADGHIVGTPSYMSPEQASGAGRSADSRSDVHSCGAVLYELLVGRPPFPSGPYMLERVIHDEPVPPRRLDPSTPRDLETITLKALAKSPSRRHESAAALGDDLQRWLDGRPILARPVGPAERLLRWCRREPVIASLAGIAVALLVALAAVSLRAATDLERERNAAIASRDRAESAERDGKAQLFDSLVAQARAHRNSPRPGRRVKALAAIDEALRLVPVLGGQGRKLALRNEALAALSLTDLAVVHDMPMPPGTGAVAFTREMETWARADALGGVSVRTVDDDVELTFLPGPGRPAEWMDFSPDGTRLLVFHARTGREKMLTAWDWRTQRVVARLDPAPVSWVFEGQGHALVVPQADDTIARLDLDRDDQMLPVPGLHGIPLAMNPSGSSVLRDASDLSRVTIADARAGGTATVIDMPGDVWAAALDPHDASRVLLTQSNDIHLLDVASQRTLAVLQGHHNPVTAVTWSPTRRHAASLSWDATVRAWDVESATLLATVPSSYPSYPVLHFSGDGRRLAYACDGVSAGILEAALDPPSRVLDGRRLLGCSAGFGDLDADGGRLLLSGRATLRGDAALLLDERGAVLARIADPGNYAARLTPDGATIVTGGRLGVRAWPLVPEEAGQRVRVGPPRLVIPGENAFSIALDRAGELVATHLRDPERVVVARLDVATLVRTIPAAPGTWLASLSPDGRRVAAGTWQDRRALTWDVATGRVERELPVRHRSMAVISPRDGAVLLLADDSLSLLDASTLLPRAALLLGGGSDVPGSAAFARDADLLAVTDGSGQSFARLLDSRTLDERARFDLPGSEADNPTWISLSADASALAVGTASGKVLRWDLRELRRDLASRGLDWE